MNPEKKFTGFEAKTENPHYENVYDIEPQELHINLNKVKVVDVRQEDEFVGELGHISVAELMVLNTLPQKLQNLPKDQTVVFVCRSGGRSAQAAAFALMNGFSDVYNLRGGMLLWNELTLPTQK